ncbi:alpha/beta hydrolase family protein [Streptomyces sp. BK022]|uniref:alpha/beta hydrolase n=1 Tax=Streptomyces sp. BK022 TaxID=2512123 RepID=UPI00102945F2|nr:alpha/beta hydrolase [Streptomyces sp. BK022]RZU45990.1 alpha/beta hydrolase family protein [Streptomyces sp. BK022]
MTADRGTEAAFVLVPEAHTGDWVWEQVAAVLRRAGARVFCAASAGAGSAPTADLETHIAEVIRQVEEAGERVVLVGHGYGLLPALGAADRRRDRVLRVVHLDAAGLPEDGDSALDVLPALPRPPGGRAEVPPPAREEWHRLGSTDGLTPAALDQLAARALPQPAATLTQPLRLSESAARIPRTGVLCPAGGSTIDRLRWMASLGDPRLSLLTAPGNTFLEVPTGHWPMLSEPDLLAKALRQAAAGEGESLALPPGQVPDHLRPFVLDVPDRPRERRERVDLYPPDGHEPRPAVVFVHGGPLPSGIRPTPRDWPTFTGYAALAARLGAVGVTLDHRLHTPADLPRAADDVSAAVDLVRAHPRVDGDRVALWFFSGGGPLSAPWLSAPPPWLRCLALNYPLLEPIPGHGTDGDRFRPAAAVRGAGNLPVVLTRVGLEDPMLDATVERFLGAAGECGAEVEVIAAPHCRHGFETLDHTAEARAVVREAMERVLGDLDA